MPSVNPDILAWARETAGLTHGEAVSKLGIKDARGVAAVDRLVELETGITAPTRPLLVKMAKQYHRPLLTFYMSKPPIRGDRGQDFRTLPEGHSTVTEALLDTLLRDVRARQSMVRAVLEDEEEIERLDFINSMKMSEGVSAVVASIQRALRMNRDNYRAAKSPEQAFNLLRNSAESLGIFVLLKSNIGNYLTAMEVDTFRGFALADEIAPFIVINDQDAKPAWSFTLLHELTHLWLGESGVSGVRDDNRIERFCNDVASEFLLPANELALLHVEDSTDFAIALRRISEFAKERHLSRSLVAYKLYRIGTIERDTWFRFNQSFRAQWQKSRVDDRERARDSEGGPNYYAIQRHRIGHALIDFSRRMIADGTLTTTKAAKILGVQAMKVQKLLEPAIPSAFRRSA